jgi:hypothetical protein
MPKMETGERFFALPRKAEKMPFFPEIHLPFRAIYPTIFHSVNSLNNLAENF